MKLPRIIDDCRGIDLPFCANQALIGGAMMWVGGTIAVMGVYALRTIYGHCSNAVYNRRRSRSI